MRSDHVTVGVLRSLQEPPMPVAVAVRIKEAATKLPQQSLATGFSMKGVMAGTDPASWSVKARDA